MTRRLSSSPGAMRADVTAARERKRRYAARGALPRRPALPLIVGLAALAFSSSPALASTAAPSPWWSMNSALHPAVLAPGASATMVVQAFNLGDGEATPCSKVPGTGKYTNSGCSEEPVQPGSGEYEKTPIVFTVKLPAGVAVQKVEPEAGKPEPRVGFVVPPEHVINLGTFEEARFSGGADGGFGPEQQSGALHTCSEPAPREVRCAFGAPAGSPETPVIPFSPIEMGVAVTAEPGFAGGHASAEITGAHAPAASTGQNLTVGSGATPPVPFGVEDLSFVPEEANGAVDARAGSHPFQLTTTFSLQQNANVLKPPALAKSLQFNLPPGLVANAVALPECSELDYETKTTSSQGFGDLCPQNTAVGVVLVTIDEPDFGGLQTYPIPVFNLVPKQGEPVRFGFFFIGIPVTIDFHVRTGEDYSASATVNNITQIANFVSESLTIWGIPGEAVHDSSRGWDCIAESFYGHHACPLGGESHPTPFLTMPTSCEEPWAASVSGASWPLRANPEDHEEEPRSIPLAQTEANTYSLKDRFGRPIGLTGCNQLPFSPFIEAAPDVQSASTSTGLKVDVKVPQEVSENAEGLASSSVKDITVALPEGVAVNPSGANGLETCSEGLVGFQADRGVNGFEEFPSEPGVETPLFTPRLPGSVDAIEVGEEGELKPGVNFCADASKIGTVEIHTPLIKNPLKGSVYLATQNQNPFGSLIAAYIVAEDPESGVLVKLPGKVMPCQSAGQTIAGERCGAPGQLVTTFENEPELPFQDAELHFFGGERAPLATPAHCGTYTSTATFTPWSGNESVNSSSSFEITSGPNDGPCPGPSLPFSPTLTGGTTNINAGGFSPLTTTISRADGQQNLQQVTLHMPAGLEGLLTNVKLCPEAQANEGTCGPESLIGETIVSAGVGSDPVTVTGGKVYLTEKYAGAPFGLSIVNPVKAGPFDLEHDTSNPAQNPPCDCVVVRAKIEVNPTTADLTVTTDPSGPHAIPHLIDGIPVEIKAVNVTVNREHFTFNPTNCNPMSLTGAIASDEGASSPLAVPFQATNCAVLKFEPKVSIATAAKASKANGASLNFKITYPKGAMGSQSWFNEVKFTIPKQLPARLTTLQKACIAATFENNRAACPAASKIGHAIVRTEVLPVPLEGPVYFVSYGGAKFPDAVMVLDGYGIHVELRGETLIKNGVTSATFRNTPDVPFESIEVNVPQGPFSEFGANLPGGKYDFCGQKLSLPTFFKAQNGLEIRQNTPIGVTGCPSVSRLALALKACHKKKGHRRQRCERQARRRYPSKKAKRTAKR